MLNVLLILLSPDDKSKAGWLFNNQAPPAGITGWWKLPCVTTSSYHKSLKMRMEKQIELINAFGYER